MIVYGSHPVRIKSHNDKTLKCPNCDTQGSLYFQYYSTHAHVFWIPLFPVMRKGYSSCSNCNQEVKPKNMTDHVRRAYDSIKSDTKVPIWQFSGLGLIAILIGFIYYNTKANDQKYKEYIANPQNGDVYSYKLNFKEYSTLKVAQITTDSIYVIPNEYVTNKRTGINEIDISSNYGDLMYGIAKTEINRMFEAEEIYEIERD